MRSLLAFTCLTPALLAGFHHPAAAELVVDAKLTTNLRTSAAKSGAADDIRITDKGSLVPTSGIAVRVDSSNNVKNDGTIQITNSNDAIGIEAGPGLAGTITNNGKIIIDESYVPADADKDGDLDGPFAQGSGRFGIRVAPGGTFTGSILNNGSIEVEGKDSGGIAIGGRLAGNLDNSGSVKVIGDRSVGIRAGDVTGNVRIAGSVGVEGASAVAVALEGDIGGALVVQGVVTSTGYRSTMAPADVSKLDADDLLQGGPALVISGNVAKGIIFDVPPKDADPKVPDEDKDGIDDAKEGSAVVASYGSQAAVQIGAADRAVFVGALAGQANGHGLVVNGSITGNGVYKDIDARGLVIGGLGGSVDIAGGMTVAGSISAVSIGANATALRIGSGAAVPEIRQGGSISASGGGGASSQTYAVVIDSGANVSAIRNTGKIHAANSGEGLAGAIVDKAGTVMLVENAGAITATANKGADNVVAIDLRANNAGATVRQLVAAKDAAAPAMNGNILFGSGNDLLDIGDGTVTGATRFGGGANRLSMAGDAAYKGDVQFGAGNDAVALSGTSSLAGNIDFGGGTDSLTLAGTSRLTGALANSGGLAVSLSGGSLDLSNKAVVNLSSLNVSGGGGITVVIDPGASTHTRYDVAGTAAFAKDSKLMIRLESILEAEGNYVVVDAGTLTGGANLVANGVDIPFLYKSSLAADDARGQISLNVKRKTTTELGLNGSEGKAFEAIYDVLHKDGAVEDMFLQIGDGDVLRSAVGQMLPDHAGGTFETVTQGSRATARFLSDPNAPIAVQDGWGFWLQQVAWGTSKGLGDTASYDVTGWGASGGVEIETGMGGFGASLAYLTGNNANGGNRNAVDSDQFELAVHWRNNWGGLHLDARASVAQIAFSGVRILSGAVDGEIVTKETAGEWDGQLYSAGLGASYEARFGRLILRPTLGLDYYKLAEEGYTEAGGGEAMDLTVAARKSDELAGTAAIAAGLGWGGATADSAWFRVELEGGRRQILAGRLGDTRARFADGEEFSLASDKRTDGWVGRVRAVGGNSGFKLAGEFSAEEQQGRTALGLRVSLNAGF